MRVLLENAGEDMAGELVIEWGGARVRRAISLPSPSRKQVELYVRASDVRDVITVRLWVNGRELRSVDVPVRIARADETVTLCVAPASALSPSSATCSATMPLETLPRSWRGYDAADGVAWQWGDPTLLARDQQGALQRWQAIHYLEGSGNTPPLGSAPVEGDRPELAQAGLMAYFLSVMGAGFALRRIGTAPVAFYSAFAVLIAAGSAAALAAGRAGPASSIVVRHASLVQQFAGASGSLISMRAVATFPAFAAFELRPVLSDATIDATHSMASGFRTPGVSGESRAEQRFDENGYPVIAGVFGLGSATRFSLEGIAEVRPLDASRRGRVTRVSNMSRFELRDCRFATGVSVQHVGVLPAGGSVEAEGTDVGDDPIFTCSLKGSLVDFTDPLRPVTSDGTSILVYHLSGGDRRP